jgi:urease accessory protein UreE
MYNTIRVPLQEDQQVNNRIYAFIAQGVVVAAALHHGDVVGGGGVVVEMRNHEIK